MQNMEDKIKTYYNLLFNVFANTKRTKHIKSVLCQRLTTEYNELSAKQDYESSDEILKFEKDITSKINLMKKNLTGVVGIRIELDKSHHNVAEDMTVIFNSSYNKPEADKEKIYMNIIKEISKIDFCFLPSVEDWWFDCNQCFVICALDEKGGCIGSMGDYSGVGDEIPVGYVSTEGYYGQVAKNLKEFLELVVFYPFWRDVIECQQSGKSYDVVKMEKEWAGSIPEFYKKQKKIANDLQLNKNTDVISRMFKNLKLTKNFRIWACDNKQTEFQVLSY